MLAKGLVREPEVRSLGIRVRIFVNTVEGSSAGNVAWQNADFKSACSPTRCSVAAAARLILSDEGHSAARCKCVMVVHSRALL